MKKLKKGTKVRVTESKSGHNYNIGDIVTIRRLIPRKNSDTYDFEMEEGNNYWLMEDEFEIVNNFSHGDNVLYQGERYKYVAEHPRFGGYSVVVSAMNYFYTIPTSALTLHVEEKKYTESELQIAISKALKEVRDE